jgi:hypothetical protein
MAKGHFRAFARRPISLQATLISIDGSWRRPAQVTDLGLGGARVEAMEVVPQGTTLKVQLQAPHLWDPLLLDGEVAWARADSSRNRAHIGVRFEHTAGSTLWQLIELLGTSRY